MTTSIRKFHWQIAAIALALLPIPAGAQNSDLDMRLPMSIDADSTTYDGKSSTLIFSGLRLSQGRIGIQADVGRAKNMELEDSTWQFSGNVIIDVDNGHIESDSADLQFDDFELKLATVSGSPATFRLTRPGTDEVTYAEAGQLLYDVDNGVIEFSDNATITEGGNQIESSILVYNIAEQRISADQAHIRYTPTNGDATLPSQTVLPETTVPEEEDENQ